MGTLKQAVDRVAAAKTAIGNAITAKGGTVSSGDGLEEFAADIATIPGPTPKDPSEFDDVVLYDIDGTIVASYTKEEFLALEDYPAHPDRTSEGLTADGWTLTFSEAQEMVQTYGIYDIGAMYVPTSGCTEVHLEIPSNNYTVTFCTLGYYGYWNGSTTVYYSEYSDGYIDWGDNSSPQSIASKASVSHTYSQAGNYIVKFIPTTKLNLGYHYYESGSHSDYFLKDTSTASVVKRIYFYIPENIQCRSICFGVTGTTSTYDNALYVFSRSNTDTLSNENKIVYKIILGPANPTRTLIIDGNRYTKNSTSGGDSSFTYVDHYCIGRDFNASLGYYADINSFHADRFACANGHSLSKYNNSYSVLVKQVIPQNNSYQNWYMIEELDLSHLSSFYFADNCFANCYKLKHLIVGENYSGSTQYYSNKFSGCYNIEDIKFTSPTPNTSYISNIISTSSVPSLFPKVLIPEGSLSDYVSATGVDAKYFEEY